ncbi:MAG: PP2C family serine/threonine-protein phosphatase [Micromonosporaceae bacterium]
MTLTLRYAAHSDRGLIRDGNQDSVYAGPRLLAVADGMGGMAAGDVASNIVIAAMAPLDEDVPSGALVDALRSGVEVANQQLRQIVEANPQFEGMGTTLTAMLFSGTKVGLVHIGDSRAYLLRDGEFSQITKDDTYVQMLIDEGRISAEEANSHPQRSLLTRAMDGRDIDPEYSVRQVLPGDRYLLCSDGLSGVVSADTIAETLRQYRDPAQCVERLVALALRGGGPDNITVIVADASDEDIVEAQPVVGGAAARDRGMTTSADASTPAARASALAAPRPASPEGVETDGGERAGPDEEDAERPKRHPVRAAVLLLVLLGIFAGGLWGGWRWTQRQYYVGVTDDGMVAVFRGVPGEIAGLPLSSVHERSGTRVEDLTKITQDTVRQGIQADDESDAKQKLAELTSDDPTNPYKWPLCSPSPDPDPASPTPSPTPNGVGVPSGGEEQGVPGVALPSDSAEASPDVEDAGVLRPSPSPCREN